MTGQVPIPERHTFRFSGHYALYPEEAAMPETIHTRTSWSPEQMKSTYPAEAEVTEDSLPLVDDAIDFHLLESKPTWRGWIHTGTFPVAIVLGIILIALADGTKPTIGAAVFVMSSLLLFGISALYHRISWSPQVKAVFRRIDHANIFLLIAGSYTPISLMCLPQEKSVILLSMVWTGALLGIGFRVFWIGAPRWLYVPLYLLLGWAAVIYIRDFFTASWLAMTLVLIGGLLYSAGAVVYGLKRPNPFPRSFGFHEIFHTLTLLAFLCHWVAVFLVTTNPPVR